jgi:hypothetical protein
MTNALLSLLLPCPAVSCRILQAAEQGAVAARNVGYNQGYAAGYAAGLMQQGTAASNPAAALAPVWPASSLRHSAYVVPQQFSTDAPAAVVEDSSNSGNSWSSGNLARSVCSERSLQLAVGGVAVEPASWSSHREGAGLVQHNTNSIPLPVSLLTARQAAVTTAQSPTASLEGSASEDAICFVSVITAACKADSSKAVGTRVAGQQAVDRAPGNRTAGSECFKWQLPAPVCPGNTLGATSGGLLSTSNSVGTTAQWGGDLLGASKMIGAAGQLGAGLFGSTNSIGPAGCGLVGVDTAAAWAANTLQDSEQPLSCAPALSCPGLFTAGDRQHSIWAPKQHAGAGGTASAGWDSKRDPITLGATSAPAREPQETVQQGSTVQGIAVGSGMQHALWGPVPAQSAGAGLAGFALAGGSVMGWPGGQQGQLPGGLWDMWDAQEGFADGGVVAT